MNHSVDTEGDGQVSADGQEAELKSRPSFEVDVKVGNRVMSFTCAFLDHSPTEEVQGQDSVEGKLLVYLLLCMCSILIFSINFPINYRFSRVSCFI